MPKAGGDIHPIILHIHSGEVPGPVAGLLERARAEGARVDSCGDVYHGLARLGTGDAPNVVVVCVDGLLPQDFEFFKLAARVRRDTPVFVYAFEGANAGVAEAVRAGAAGPLDAAALASAGVGEWTAHTTTAREPVQPGKGTAAGEREPRAALDAAQLQMDDPSPESGEELEAGEAPVFREHRNGDAAHVPLDDAPQDREIADSEPVRVPWLQYEQQPARVPPRRSPPGRVAPAETRAGALNSDGPLLTEEEVRALIGDDVSSFPSRGDEHHPV